MAFLSFIDCETKARSNNEMESLTDPSEFLAINVKASSVIFPFHSFEIKSLASR